MGLRTPQVWDWKKVQVGGFSGRGKCMKDIVNNWQNSEWECGEPSVKAQRIAWNVQLLALSAVKTNWSVPFVRQALGGD